jgi:uncharacterized RDD family membrane protein YckC
MKCHGCGHEFAKTLNRCPRCHRSTARRSRASTDSRLLEFPKRARTAAPAEAPVSLPAWRAELNEKVRAIRARRSADSQAAGAETPENSFEIDTLTEAAVQQQTEPAIPYGANVSLRNPKTRTAPIERTPMPAASASRSRGGPTCSPQVPDMSGAHAGAPLRRTSSNIVEAALIRVKRASENASRAALPKIEPARTMPASAQAGLAVDRQATARALEPAPEIESNPEPPPSPRPELVQNQFTKPARVDPVIPEKEIVKTVVTPSAETQPSFPPFSEDIAEQTSKMVVIDELEPLDYLEAEVRKVDKALGAEFLRNESPSVLTHAVIFCVDAIAVAASCSPFLAIIRIADGNFASAQTRITSGAVVALIAFFYLALTQTLCGRTFGMMFTNTRIVDSQSFEAPSASRALLRTVGYFIAAVPGLLGIIWAAFNRKRRGWQDFISGTVVVRDF